MKQRAYPYRVEGNKRYTFVSEGRTQIIKVVDFGPTSTENLFNIGFGDLAPDGSLDDMAKSNNGDIVKVLSTVVLIIRDFTERFPERKIIFTGSTEERTKLYARILKMHIGELHREFIISALTRTPTSYKEVPFKSQDAFTYFAFLIKKIQ
ncbi:MAG TPA: hypothetical protein VF939_06345 [Puia sp.]